MYQIAILHRIRFFPFNINTTEFCFRHFGSCYDGTTVSLVHVVPSLVQDGLYRVSRCRDRLRHGQTYVGGVVFLQG